MTQRSHSAGFTLIEVLIAMFVIALGLGALLSTMTSSAESVTHLRDKSFAQWIALNRLSETRLEQPAPGVGEANGEVDYAGNKWTWRREITDPEVAGILRVTVSVEPLKPGKQTAGNDADKKPAMATAYGFIGTGVAAPNGTTPAWNQPVPTAPGSQQNPGGQQVPGLVQQVAPGLVEQIPALQQQIPALQQQIPGAQQPGRGR